MFKFVSVVREAERRMILSSLVLLFQCCPYIPRPNYRLLLSTTDLIAKYRPNFVLGIQLGRHHSCVIRSKLLRFDNLTDWVIH